MKKLFLICVVLTGCIGHPRRSPYRFYIPEGYVGWVQLEFEVRDAPPLAGQDGYRLVRFPPDGIARTSSAMEDGWAKDEFYAYAGNDLTPLSDGYQTGVINAGATGTNGTVHFWRFFVGPYADYMTYGYPNNGNPIIGPVSR